MPASAKAGTGIAGVVPEASLYACKVSNNMGSGNYSDLGAPGFDPLYGYGLVNAGPVVIPAPSALILALLGVSVLHRRRRCGSPR